MLEVLDRNVPAMMRQIEALETIRINQLVVDATLRTTRDPDIFAIGDCAACPHAGTSTTVPPRAQAAHQARQIERRLRGQPPQPCTYHDFGSLVSLGRGNVAGSLLGFPFSRGIFIEALFARIMYRSLRLMHERALSGTTRALLALIARGFAHRVDPLVKLH